MGVMLFDALFVVLCLLCAALFWLQNCYNRNKVSFTAATKHEFRRFQTCYLLAYALAVTGDWLQGPYVYALYAAYDFSKQQIAVLFIVGFGASGILGAFTGVIADRFGRRLSCHVYCATYIASCLSKHSADFNVLLFGRLAGGVATSILFSSFEAWLVSEHTRRGFQPQLLNETLSLATLLNYVSAIGAAWLGAFVRSYFDSLVAPFDLAILFLSLAVIFIAVTWPENRGATDSGAPPPVGGRSRWTEAMRVLKDDRKIVLLGLIQSCFEAPMYIFVFMWTPKLESTFEDLPHGQVFGCFMACCMMGSSLVGYLVRLRGSPVFYMREHLFVSAVCLTLPAVYPGSGALALVCFFVFEAAVGVYWPSIGIVKSRYVPERVRATLYNVFRVPLNFFVVIVLANLGSLSDDAVFGVCGCLLLAASLMQHFFMAAMMAAEAAPDGEEGGEMTEGRGDARSESGAEAVGSGAGAVLKLRVDAGGGETEARKQRWRQQGASGAEAVDEGGVVVEISKADDAGTSPLLS